MLESIVTTKFSPANLAIGSTGIGLTAWYLKTNYKHLIEMVQNRLDTSLKRELEDNSKQPLHKIFYNYNHNSIKAWLSWYDGQDEFTQKTAFRKLTEHLEKPFKEHGAITNDVIFAIREIANRDSFEILSEFLKRSRRKWGYFKALKSFFENCLNALIELDPKKAYDTITYESRKASGNVDCQDLLKIILDSIKSYSDIEDIDIEDTISNITCENKNSTLIREYALNLMSRNDAINKKILEKSLSKFLEKSIKASSKDDIKIIKLVLDRSSEYLSIETPALWKLFMVTTRKKMLKKHSMNLLASLIRSKDLEFSEEQLFELYKIDKSQIGLELAKRNDLSEEEFLISKKLFDIDDYSFRKEFTKIFEQNSKNSVPKTLLKTFEEFSGCTKKSSGGSTKLLLKGPAELDKIVLSRKLAESNSQKFIYVNVENILKAKHMIFTMKEMISKNSPCLVFFENFEKACDQELQHSKIFQLTFDSLGYSNNTFVFSISDKASENEIDLVKFKYSEKIVGEALFENLSKEAQLKLYNHYSFKLKPERESIEQDFSELYTYTENKSSSFFERFFFSYLQISLLIFGKLISIKQYQEFIDKKEETSK